MIIHYEVNYTDSVVVEDSLWEDLKEDYENDFTSFVFVSAKLEAGAFRGLKIIHVENKPEGV